MSDVKWVTDASKIPGNQKSVLVEYGDENALHRHSGGLTYTVDANWITISYRRICKLSFLKLNPLRISSGLIPCM
jgi:hypothetical protein